jgi:hypothetical protein
MNPSMNELSPAQARSSTANAEPRAAAYFRWAGYALLSLALLDLLEALIPPGFMNPAWELQFMGDTIERSPVGLLGFMLVFHGEWQRRAGWEKWVLPALSWASLAVGLAFALMIPLLVVNTLRVGTGGEKQINAQLDQQISQARSLHEAFTSAQGPNLEALLRRAGRTLDGADVEALRAEMLAELAKAEKELQRRAEEARETHKLTLHKRTYKHVTQAAIVGAVLVVFWFGTSWARRTRRRG